MTNIKGQHLITITAEANETYAVDYGTTYTVNICNHTDDVLVVSDKADYPGDGTFSGCIKIAADAFYNALTVCGRYLFVTPSADGDITIVKTA